MAQATGMDQNSASGLLQTIAPLSMGAVGQAQQQNALDASDLSNLLNSQQQQAQANAPDAMGKLGSMLDQNQDGSAMDDLQRRPLISSSEARSERSDSLLIMAHIWHRLTRVSKRLFQVRRRAES
jgi:hypothetical protein